MDRHPRGNAGFWTEFGRVLSAWGAWPCAAICLCQWEAARLTGLTLPPHRGLLTVAGAAAVYGADRWLERLRFPNLAARHRANPRIDGAVAVAIIVVGWLGLAGSGPRDWLWLTSLGFGGALYLGLTLRLLPAFPGLKELTGAACFSLVVLGPELTLSVPVLPGVFALGLANFLWSGQTDRQRDAANRLRSAAVLAPRLLPWLARAFALSAAIQLAVACDWRSPLVWTALAHLDGPHLRNGPVDAAFLPMLAVPAIILLGR